MANKKPQKNNTIDVVPCKKCKSRLKIGKDSYICGNPRGLARLTPDSYCSYGERKPDGK